MERAVFDRMAELDQRHWWYVARRRILADLIAREVKLPPAARILEIGCGTGHNFEMLGRFGEVDAIEIDEPARLMASERLGREVGSASLPELAGIPERIYHLIALLDVLEHVDGRPASLASIATRLAPGGRILVTVPAYQWMWSGHDVAHHHLLRYTKRSLRADIEAAGLEIRKIEYFNTLLFPPAAALRLIGKALGRGGSDDKMMPWPINPICKAIFSLERHIVGKVPAPFGLSIFALLSTR